MGSNYPTGILPYPVTPILDGDTIWDYHIYQLYDDVSGIEVTLGTGVQGSYATLRERIEAITVGSNFVSKAGDIMSGNLNFNGSNPVISGKDNLTFVAWGSDGELVFRAGGSEFSTISMYVNGNTVVTYSSGLVNNQVIQRTQGVYPSADGIYDLGTDTKHYKTLWVDAISGINLTGIVTNSTQYMEQPSGVVNGVNAVFTLNNSPYDNSLMLYRNGLLMIPSGVSDVTYDFVLSGNTITYAAAPPSGTLHIAARYEY